MITLRRAVVVAVAALCLALSALAGPASAAARNTGAPAASSGSVNGALAVTAATSTRNHASVASSTLTQHRQAVEHHLTTKYGTLTYGWRPGGAVTPDTGSNCNIDVCTTIVGESVFVDDWNTQGYYSGPAPLCTVAYFYVNGVEQSQTDLICGDGAGVFYADWNSGTQGFLDQTRLCNQWKKIPGESCVTIVR